MKTFCNKKAIPMLFILLSLLLFPAVSFAEYVGSFSRIEGRVDLLRAGATTVVPARRGDGVSTGDIIRTKSDGRAEILFKDDTTVTVASETRLKIDEYAFNPDNSRSKGMLSLLRGKIRAAVSRVKAGLIPVSLGSSTFSVNTPTSVAGVRGTVFFVFFDKGITGVIFKEGNGFVYNQNMPDKIVNVSEGQATFILTDDTPPLPPRTATEAEMSRHIIDTTIDGGHTDTDTSGPLDQTGGGDVSGYKAPKTADTGVDPSPPPPVLPITETNAETLKDTIPPLITITSSPQAITNSPSGSFTITANELVTFTYSMDSWGATIPLTTSDTIDLAGLPEGSHTLSITATDVAGNVSASSYSWTTDYTAPASLSLTGTPASVTNINTVTIGATATDANGVTYSYTLDGAASTGALTSLTEGTHTFVATATDGAGNISTTSYTWITDTIAPASLALTGTPASITNINTATIGATATDANAITYSYTLDGASSTGALTSLTEGTHTFVATATDAAGNVSTSSYAWTTDYTAPASLALTGTPAVLTNINTATIGATAADANGVTYSYTLDGAASTGALTGLTEGSHTFTVTATDAAGNTSTISYAWTTDYTGPVATLTPAASPEAGDLATINVGLSSNESSTYVYRLDGGSLTSTGATLTLSGIPEGSHTVEVQATDAAGNPSTETLAFGLSRYSLSGNFWGCIGNVTGTATGEVAGISGQNWGGWNMTMGGTGNPTPNATWTLFAGGTSSDATYADGRNNGYWIEVAPGSSTADPFPAISGTLSGTSTLRYLSHDRMGLGTGSLTGTFDGLGGYSLTDLGTGTYTETPLAWSGRTDYDRNDYGLYYSNVDGIWGAGNTYGGLAGGTQTPWTVTNSLTLRGPYWGPLSTDIGPFMWNAPIYSWNVNTSQYRTYDGGAFWGLTGGMWWDSDNLSTTAGDRNIDARIYSLYIDPSGNAGILRGDLAGVYYPELNMFSADGTWTPTLLATGLDPTTLGSLTYSPDIYFSSLSSSTGGFTAGGTIYGNSALGTKYSITGQDWGIWQTLAYGGYSGTSSDTWDMSLGYADLNTIIGTETQGTQWSNQRLAGTTLGFGADITTTPKTWISVGETIGTFNSTMWQAVQTGAWLDTNRFLAMTQTVGGQAALTALNIPFAEVGRTNLTGSGTMGGAPVNVYMNDTTFFAYSNGASPKIWATNAVGGDYGCSACGSATVGLTGPDGLGASFNIQTFDTTTGKWAATVGGVGVYSGTGSLNGSFVVFGGAAAGGINTTNSTFSGTGSGVAK